MTSVPCISKYKSTGGVMKLNKASVYVQQAVSEFESQRFEDYGAEYQQAAGIIKYTLERVSESKRHDRFYASMKNILKALNKFPHPSIGVIKQQCSSLVDVLDEDGKEFLAFQKRFA
jgi:hypothetical protein